MQDLAIKKGGAGPMKGSSVNVERRLYGFETSTVEWTNLLLHKKSHRTSNVT